jgi:hypothetical protein
MSMYIGQQITATDGEDSFSHLHEHRKQLLEKHIFILFHLYFNQVG